MNMYMHMYTFFESWVSSENFLQVRITIFEHFFSPMVRMSA